ncbi:MAG: hypothetical protein RDU13_00910 [Elusimicrobiales bacterium]|jgi:hypothetical protein|nr:hypothetical protein [Elusimicrobiales bacterium]
MKLFLGAMLISFVVALVSAQTQHDDSLKSLDKFFFANMPSAAWPVKAEADFTAFIGEVSTAAFIHKGSFSAPGLPSALILDRPRKENCGYDYDDLRIVDYKDGRWRDILRIKRKSEKEFVLMDFSGRKSDYKDGYCVDFDVMRSHGKPRFLLLKSAHGRKGKPWVYSEGNGGYIFLADQIKITEDTIEEWFSYYFPDNSDKWSQKTLKTLESLRTRLDPDFIWKGDLFGTGNPAVFMLSYKDASGKSSGPDGGKKPFHAIRFLEYRKKWGGWKERLSIGDKIHVDGEFAGDPVFDYLHECQNTSIAYDMPYGGIGICSATKRECATWGEIVPCIGYSRHDDMFDASDFTDPKWPTGDAP